MFEKYKMILFLGIALALAGIGFFYPDNFVEQFVERMIKSKTGADIDLSPTAEAANVSQTK
jgi:hypothetical protein